MGILATKVLNMKAEKPFYGVRYSEFNKIRTTEAQNFNKMKDTLAFLNTVNHGYALRLAPKKAKVLRYKNFEPSAQEGLTIKSILNSWNK